MKKPITFFVHHQGRGHANRTMAVARQFSADRPVTVLTAGPHLFDGFTRDIEIVALPNMIGASVPTARLFAEPKAWGAMQRRGMRTDVSWDASARDYMRLFRSLVA